MWTLAAGLFTGGEVYGIFVSLLLISLFHIGPSLVK